MIFRVQDVGTCKAAPLPEAPKDWKYIIPRASDHVNMHNFTMHIWGRHWNNRDNDSEETGK